ncbi:LCP family protein [Arthrobacter castelli]|uniref:LCP family protein n=1 Tax=Arthrobacter castelli TaxID=271431 RepID=UPI0006877B7F|nr:LCP family protein [Arthrobacter castelli]
MMPPRHGRLRNTQPRRGGLPVTVGWTAVNAALPGTAMLKTGRKSGWIYLAVFVGIPLLAILAFLLFGGVDLALKMAVRPRILAVAAIGISVLALVWAVLVLRGNHLLNGQFTVEGRKRTVSVVVALALVAVLAVPTGYVVRSLEAQRSLLLNSFATEDDVGMTGDTGTGPDEEQSGDPWAGEPRLNIMMLGHDSGEGRVGTRPDTIMVASIDTSSGATSLFSIPRNMQFVQFPPGSPMHQVFPNGFDAYPPNQNLINAVWHWAAGHPKLFPDSDHPGRTATRHAVEQTLGLKIDRYAMVNLDGFEAIINALGGVEIKVERRIPIGGGSNQYTGEQYPIDGYIEPGLQVLDGHEALWYARSREGSNDFDRMCRQQRMIRAVTDSVNPASIASSFIDLVQAAENNVSTSIRINELDAMIDLLFKVREQGISSHPITPEVTNPAAPDFDFLHQWVDKKIAADVAEATGQSEEPESGSTSSADENSGSETAGQDGSGTSSATPDAPETGQAGQAGGSGDKAEDEGALARCMP